MCTNHPLPAWRVLLACVVALAALACGSSPNNPAATTEPVVHTFVGHLEEQPALKLALLVGRVSTVAYLCDNHGGAILLRGTVNQHGSGGTAELKAADGITLSATFGAGDATGTVTLPGQPADLFTARPATDAAGMYEASGTSADGSLQGRWIVGNDGQVSGALRLNGQVVDNPALSHTVRVGTTTLTPIAVRVLPVPVPEVQQHPVPTPTTAHVISPLPVVPTPVIDNAFSWRCGGDFHVDGHNFDPTAPVQILVNILTPEVNFIYTPLVVPPNEANGNLAADFAYILGPTPLTNAKNADIDALEFPGKSNALPTHASAYMC